MAHSSIPECLYSPIFLKFVEYFTNKFKEQNGYGRWLHEYQELETTGMLKPLVIRDQYIKMLSEQFLLGYIKGTAYWYIGINAQKATETYYTNIDGSLYKICIITGETALDEDGDEFIELSYSEAEEICKALNDEAEENLFVVKRM